MKIEIDFKYFYKVLKSMPRRKIIIFSFAMLIVFGLAHFYINEINLITIIFLFACAIFLYNIFYVLYLKIKTKA